MCQIAPLLECTFKCQLYPCKLRLEDVVLRQPTTTLSVIRTPSRRVILGLRGLWDSLYAQWYKSKYEWKAGLKETEIVLLHLLLAFSYVSFRRRRVLINELRLLTLWASGDIRPPCRRPPSLHCKSPFFSDALSLST